MNPFDYVNSINKGSPNMMRDTENDVKAESGYSSWLTNMALSYHVDTLLHANLMNEYHWLDNRPQYEFLINSVRPGKRFSKWAKKNEEERKNIELVSDYYGCNERLASQYLQILTGDQLEEIRQEYDEGGMK